MTQRLDLPLTRHAPTRLRKRGIPPMVPECLLDSGRPARDHRPASQPE